MCVGIVGNVCIIDYVEVNMLKLVKFKKVLIVIMVILFGGMFVVVIVLV